MVQFQELLIQKDNDYMIVSPNNVADYRNCKTIRL